MTARRNAFVRRGALGLALIVLLTTGAFAAGASTSGNARTRGIVLFVGDSNVTISAAAIDTELTWWEHHDNGYVPVFASRVGASIRTADCIDAANCSTFNYWKLKLGTILPKLDADAIVNDLGINDTLSEGAAGTPGYAGYGAKIDWFMGLVGDKLVFWTLLPCAIEPPAREVGCKRVNVALSQAAERWPNLTVLAWNGVANDHPEYMSSPGSSNVHYSPEGRAAWARFVAAALDSRFPEP
jgi:lysophospholipase L1-like esterase